MEPGDALRRVAYLLERGRAESYKVRAFRRAAATVEATDRAVLERLAAAGRLRDLDGVGETTARVIAEAMAGGTPEYLRALENEPQPALSETAAALRRALRGDCHSHSDWSDGGSPIREMAEAARALDHEYLALTDHSPRLTVAHGLDATRLEAQLEEVARVNEEMVPWRLLTGIEVDILEDGSLDQSEELLARLDVVVASVHSKLRMEARQMTRRMIRAVESPHVDILGHCTGRLIAGRGRPESSFDADAVFDACARTGTAVEVNSRPERRDPPPALLALAAEKGCLVSIDTDAHAPGQLEWLELGCEQAAEAGLGPDRVVNALSVDELLAWTASHEG
ncbi:MAG TPA: PHP domain-containing protein [Acidimicrobiales bacterium]|nr:PHP domain-containing protein [Acidimicrobiales bacterium]